MAKNNQTRKQNAVCKRKIPYSKISSWVYKAKEVGLARLGWGGPESW
jgi:hypothetical protein